MTTQVVAYRQSSSYDLARDGNREHIIFTALYEALHGLGLHFITRHDYYAEVVVPDTIRVEIVERGWDICVKVTAEKEIGEDV